MQMIEFAERNLAGAHFFHRRLGLCQKNLA